jgi:hypothetical protein
MNCCDGDTDAGKQRPLEPLVESLLEPRSIHPPDLQRRSIVEHHNIVAMGVLHEFVNAVKVNNVGPVNTKELTGIELGFQTAENLTVQIFVLRGMDGHVNTCCGDPSNIVHVDETNAAPLLECEPVEVVGASRFGPGSGT